MKTRIVISWLLVLSVLTLNGSVVVASETSLEDAVLKSNWKKVVDFLEKDDQKANDPVARLLMAHASLATNRNNASTRLFLSVKEEKELKTWSDWTASLLRKHSQSATARYLAADAKARTGNLQEAIIGFSQALEVKDDFALALNARGVAHVFNNEWDEAGVDFYRASQVAPAFADAYANLGTLAVLQESSLRQGDAALIAFNQAVELNPDFALAYNGRGCLYFGSGEFERAAEDFRRASQLSPELVVAEINQGFASSYASQVIVLASLDAKPGSTLESRNIGSGLSRNIGSGLVIIQMRN